MARKMELVNIHGQMERSMKEIGIIIIVKVKVHRNILQVMSMWVSG